MASSLQAPVLFSIAEDLTQMELQVDVDEADVGKVKASQRAAFGVDAFPDRKFPATIRDVRYASETIQGVVTYKAVLEIDNSELLLRPGMTATAELRVQEIAETLQIPNQALRYAPPVQQSSDLSFLRRLWAGRLNSAAPARASRVVPTGSFGCSGTTDPHRSRWSLGRVTANARQSRAASFRQTTQSSSSRRRRGSVR